MCEGSENMLHLKYGRLWAFMSILWHKMSEKYAVLVLKLMDSCTLIPVDICGGYSLTLAIEKFINLLPVTCHPFAYHESI